VSEFVDEDGPHRRVIGTKSRGRRKLNAKKGDAALAQRSHSTTNQRALTRPNVRHYFDRRHCHDHG
jgi:hypothetical protein